MTRASNSQQTPSSHTITRILQSDDAPAEVIDNVFPFVYEELREMAHRQLARERSDHTLCTTSLVHEAYLKLAGARQTPGADRAYFFGAAARAMRQILVDHARHHARQKRGGGRVKVTLHDGDAVVRSFADHVLDLDTALTDLAALNQRAARVVECRFFGGMSTTETARALGVSSRTVKRDWIVARAWLYRALESSAR